MRPFLRVLSVCLLSGWLGLAHGFEPFVAEEIEVEGLQRISAGTVFNYLPIKKGDRVDEEATAKAVRELYKTGFFRDVALERENDVLVVFVEERPAIASIEFEGNEDIPTDQLLENLKQIGFAQGRIFDRSMLDKVKQELKRQYLARGKYGVRIQSTVTPMRRNRVGIRVAIAEGEVATIRRINIVGNTVFDEQELLEKFELGTTGHFAFFSDRDQYSKQRLSGDLETLRTHYMDRGYINFNVESTQVAITPDRGGVYITINIHEGERHSVESVTLAGDTIVPTKELRELVSIDAGDVFSRTEVTESSNRISERLGEVGYAFANVNAVPEVKKEARKVALTFFIDPAKRVYVRRVNIRGNAKTQDEVIRREMRQMEGGLLATQRVKRSRTRVERLGYFEEASVETPQVPGSPDQVDVNMNVKEKDAFGSLSFGVGYGESQGFLINTSISQQNFLGTGKKFSLSFNNSDVNTVYRFSVTEPYATLDGVSRTINAFYRKTDTGEADIVNYTTDTYGAGVSYGVPLTEFTSFDYGFDYENTVINTTDYTATRILDFCRDNATEDDCAFDALKLSAGWTRDSRNRTIFATRGSVTSLGAQVAPAPGSVEFYKADLRHQQYFALTDSLTLAMEGRLNYGEGFGDTTELPPFERYYAGGIRTLRGYKGNSLGPLDDEGDPLGGNARVLGGAELIFPSPFSENSKSTKLSAFVDAGNVYDTTDTGIDLGDLRYSTGLSLVWMSPVGVLSFSVAEPINAKADDETETFQFTLGSVY